MESKQNKLYHVSSISWGESWNDVLVNNNALQKSDYIEVPSNLNGEDVYKFIDQKLYESTTIIPWYYNVDKIKD